MPASVADAIHVCFIHDDKPGHLSQLEGLAYCLTLQRPEVVIKWHHCRDTLFSWRIKASAQSDLRPHLVIGAGHQTHRRVLLHALRYQAFSAILMRPSLPLRLFDAVIAPEHDGLAPSPKVLPTFGVINKSRPSPLPPLDQTEPNLLLIGGPSKHYHWDDTALIQQIGSLCQSGTNKPWQLLSSPRTPDTFISTLEKECPDNLSITPFGTSETSTLSDLLKQTRQVWITPDSASMVYESLTTGRPTGLLELQLPKRGKSSRVARGVERLISDGWVLPFQRWQKLAEKPKVPPYLWEAERAAQWLLDRTGL